MPRAREGLAQYVWSWFDAGRPPTSRWRFEEPIVQHVGAPHGDSESPSNASERRRRASTLNALRSRRSRSLADEVRADAALANINAPRAGVDGAPSSVRLCLD